MTEGFIAVGYTYDHDSTRDDIYMVKVDSTGIELWDDYLGIDTKFDHAQGVIEDSGGNYVITGFTRIGTGDDHSFVWKKSSTGANVGSIHILNGGSARCNQNDLVQIGSSYYLAGWSAAASGYANLMKVSTDTSLSAAAFFDWERTYDGPNSGDNAQAVVATPEGGVLLVGKTGSDIYVVKTSSAGTVIWDKTINKGNSEEALDVCATSDGGYAIAGITNSIGAGDYDFYLIKINADGHVLWEHTFGSTAADRAFAIGETPDGGFVLAGVTKLNGHEDLYVVRTDSGGNLAGN